MKSEKRGTSTLAVEVTNVSSHGFWILIGNNETFVPFDDFPWFRGATIGELTNVELPSSHHLYWPDLDVDLAVESLERPDKYPLVSKGSRLQSATAREQGKPYRATRKKQRGSTSQRQT